MTKVFCSVEERFVNPLFEVFGGGDLVLSSYRDVEQPLAEMRIYVETAQQADAARQSLAAALEVVGASAAIEETEIADEDWKFAYRRHFKTELVSSRVLVQPEWERDVDGLDAGVAVIKFDPGLAFGTGKHETTKACLRYIDELADEMRGASFLDMGCGSGILSIAAAKLGFGRVEGFDVDPDAVEASRENAAKNGAAATFVRFALGRGGGGLGGRDGEGAVATGLGAGGLGLGADVVAANILGPLLIRFADEIAPRAGRYLIVSGILTDLYPEVLAAYAARGFAEVSRKTIGEWTTGLLRRVQI